MKLLFLFVAMTLPALSNASELRQEFENRQRRMVEARELSARARWDRNVEQILNLVRSAIGDRFQQDVQRLANGQTVVEVERREEQVSASLSGIRPPRIVPGLSSPVESIEDHFHNDMADLVNSPYRYGVPSLTVAYHFELSDGRICRLRYSAHGPSFNPSSGQPLNEVPMSIRALSFPDEGILTYGTRRPTHDCLPKP